MSINNKYHGRCLNNFGELPYNQYDYSNTTYPTPFNILTSNNSEKYAEFGRRSKILSPFVQTGTISQYNNTYKCNILQMTGTSDNHLVVLIHSVLSFFYYFSSCPILIVDYGLNKTNLCRLRWLYTFIHNINPTTQLYYRKYNFENFPTWMNIMNDTTRGGYSWKVISIVDAIREWKAKVMWNDAGNTYSSDVQIAIRISDIEGIYIPSTVYRITTMRRWLSAKTRYYLIKNKLCRNISIENLSTSVAGFMIFDYRFNSVVERILKPWYQCAFTQKCIMPYGEIHHKTTLPEQGVMGMLVVSERKHYSNNVNYFYVPNFWLDTTIESFGEYFMKLVRNFGGNPEFELTSISSCINH